VRLRAAARSMSTPSPGASGATARPAITTGRTVKTSSRSGRVRGATSARGPSAVLTLTCQDRLVVVQTLAFLVLRQMLSVVGCGRTSEAKDVEIAVLGHQLAVLGRQVSRPRYTPGDRMVLARLAKLLPRDGWKVFLVTPSTLLRWHRELIRRRWTYSATGRRRGLDPEVVELVLRMARDNARWGYLRIAGECRKLGVTVSATSVRTILRRHRLGPAPRRGGPTWTRFLRTQATGALTWPSTPCSPRPGSNW
jgi:transposase